MSFHRVMQGDVLDSLRTLADGSVHCCVTSPPYWGLRDYGTATWEGGDAGCDHSPEKRGGRFASPVSGKQASNVGSGTASSRDCPCGARRIDQQLGLEPTPEAYVARMVEVFREVRRVLRDDGTLWLNIGDSYAANMSAGIGRKAGTPEWNAVNDEIKPARIVPDGMKPKDLVGIPWLLAFALRADGWYLRSDIIWSKPNPMPESVTDRPTKAHEYVFLMSKAARYWYDAEAVSEECGPFRTAGTNNGLDRPKTPDPRKKQDALGKQTYTGFNDRYRENPRDARNRRTVWTIATQPYPEAHFATYPEALVEPCIKAGCPEGGTVLDPFLGSGTTLAVAAKLGRSGIGIELNPAYVALAEKRIGLAKNPHTWRDASRADAASLFHQEPA